MSVWFTGMLFVVGAIFVGYLPAQLLRRRYGEVQPADTRAVASDVMARIGVMHGLILSLVFASAHGGAQKFEDDVTAEASATTQVYFNAQRYGALQVQAASVAYLQAAIDKDWPVLRERNQAGDTFRERGGVTDVEPARIEGVAGEEHAGESIIDGDAGGLVPGNRKDIELAATKIKHAPVPGPPLDAEERSY